MKEPRIYVDFNEMIDSNVVLLSQTDFKKDSDGNTVELKDGMKVKIYMDDLNDLKEPDNLITDGTVELNVSGFLKYVNGIAELIATEYVANQKCNNRIKRN